MTITLVNCKSKWALKGIDPTMDGWQEKLTDAILGYALPIDGWDYDYNEDRLQIKMSGTITVPASIVDFGDGEAVELG